MPKVILEDAECPNLKELNIYIEKYLGSKYCRELRSKVQQIDLTTDNLSEVNQKLVQFITNFESTKKNLLSKIFQLWIMTLGVKSMAKSYNSNSNKFIIEENLKFQLKAVEKFNELVAEIKKITTEQGFEPDVSVRIQPIKTIFFKFSQNLIQQLAADLKILSSRPIGEHSETKTQNQVCSPKSMPLSPQKGSSAFFPSTSVPSTQTSASGGMNEKNFKQKFSC